MFRPRTIAASEPVTKPTRTRLIAFPLDPDCTEWGEVLSHDEPLNEKHSVIDLTSRTAPIDTDGEEVSRFERRYRRRLPSFPPRAA
jgi:hypothetical protein